MDKLHTFYCTKAWRDLSYQMKVLAQGKCARCGKYLGMDHLAGHHTVKLTDNNVDDASISLNPELIEVICSTCHNKEHKHFVVNRHVYIVYGSPLSGKSSLVKEVMQSGDIVLDMDSLWEAITFQPEYDKPDNCKYNIFKLRDDLLDQIKTRFGRWHNAYIIGGYPDRYERERLSQTLGAELIYCESTKEECLQRRLTSLRPAEWDEYINKWWERYTPGGDPFQFSGETDGKAVP